MEHMSSEEVDTLVGNKEEEEDEDVYPGDEGSVMSYLSASDVALTTEGRALRVDGAPQLDITPSWERVEKALYRTWHRHCRQQSIPVLVAVAPRRSGKSEFLRSVASDARTTDHFQHILVCTTNTSTYHNNWSDKKHVGWVTHFIERSAHPSRHENVLILIDDANHIDKPTLGWCEFLVRNSLAPHTTIVATMSLNEDGLTVPEASMCAKAPFTYTKKKKIVCISMMTKNE